LKIYVKLSETCYGRTFAVADVGSKKTHQTFVDCKAPHAGRIILSKLTWLALGGDQAARSRRVEQLTAL